MKIAMLTSDYLPGIGGIASHIYELSRALENAGHEVEVWYWNRKEDVFDTDLCGDIPMRFFSKKTYGKKGRALTMALAGEINRCLEEFDAQVLHVHTLDHLMGSVKQIRKKYQGVTIWTNHTSRFLRKVDSFWWRWKLRSLSSGFDGLLAPSEELLEKSLFLPVKKEYCRYIANGVDIDKFTGMDRNSARKTLNISKDRFVILSTRRFSPKNGIRFLAQALEEVSKAIPEVLCIFCGDTQEAKDRPIVQKMIRDRQLQPFTRFEGIVPNALINTYIGSSDLVVLPSLMEATSISGLEAMSAARPLVGTRVGGIPELIEDGRTGFLVEPADAHSLAQGIIKLYGTDNRELMGHYARGKIVREYSWAGVAGKVIEFYRDCLRTCHEEKDIGNFRNTP